MAFLERNYLEKYLFAIRSQGRYMFTLDELKEQFDTLTTKAINQNIYRLKAKGEIASIRNGIYVIIPPEFSNQGMLPPFLFIDDLMKILNKSYYVAFLSAAAIYGAAHQQPMEYFVMAENPAPKTINNKKLKINFASKNNWITQGIIEHKTDSGYINVSSPELTALDLFAYINKFGINRIISVLQELVDEMKPSELAKIGKMYENTAAIQRLGYVLEFEILHEKLAESLWKAIEKRKIFPVYLSVQKEKNGKSNNRWKVIKNIEIESDL